MTIILTLRVPTAIPCDRTFDSDEALQQHKRDCTTCDRDFGNHTALVQHLGDSPFMLHSSTVTTAIDPLISPTRLASACSVIRLPLAAKLSASICVARLFTLHLSSVRPAIDPSEARRLSSSTYGIRPSMLNGGAVVEKSYYAMKRGSPQSGRDGDDATVIFQVAAVRSVQEWP